MALISSSYTATQSVTPANADWWLKDPLDPSVNAAVGVTSWAPKVSESTGVFGPLGRSRPVVVSDGLNGEDGTLTLEAINAAEWLAIQALTERPKTLLLQSPWGDNHYIRIIGERTIAVEMSVAFPIRTVSINYVEVDIP